MTTFLLSNVHFWLEKYHADGIRVDGVSSILYLNYGLDGDSPNKRYNKYGDEGNLEAIDFLRQFNHMVGEKFPGAFTVAEESSAWPMATFFERLYCLCIDDDGDGGNDVCV